MSDPQQPGPESPHREEPAIAQEQPARALAKKAQTAPRGETPSNLQKAAGVMRTVMPVVQKMLPLLDGNIAAVVAGLLAPGSSAPAPRVDLEPLEHALAKLHVEQREMRGQMDDQKAALKRMADQLAAMKEAADRSAQEQQELAKELASTRRKLKTLAWVGLGLLVISIAATVVLAARIG